MWAYDMGTWDDIYQYRKTFVCSAYNKLNTFEKLMDRYGHEKIFDRAEVQC